MKYKVGDKVKVRKDLIVDKKYGKHYFVDNMQKMSGKIVTIEEVMPNYYYIEELDFVWTDEMFESKQFTKADLKDNHIVEYENGLNQIAKKIKIDMYNNDLTRKDDNKGLDIEKVYEFDKCVWKREEPKKEILNKEEKKYLSNVISPFKKEIKFICKRKDGFYYYIDIDLDNDAIGLPYFKSKKMYKGMEIDKEYTLKELGLDD